MALFEVPGWSMTAAPIESSRKRKRGDGGDNVQSEVNLERLMKRIKHDGGEETSPSKDTSPRSRRMQKKDNRKAKGLHVSTAASKSASKELSISAPQPLQKLKKPQAKEVIETRGVPPQQSRRGLSEALTSGLTSLQKGMKQSLDGARFRWINEVLYKINSEEAHRMMKDDPNVYEEYHTGFRHQTQNWPTNPVMHYISLLSAYPRKTVIADLGCGEASLAKALIPKGMTVVSFDLLSDGAFVVEADICGKLPLPGSEGLGLAGEQEGGEGSVVDVVVCALCLMGTNWPKCIREAWRVLKSGGELKIAEVASRFTDVDGFVSLVSSIGFRLASMDNGNTHFTLFEFKKISRKMKAEREWEKVMSRGNLLKPCEYKRR